MRSLIEDIRDVRFHKVETGLETISGRTHAVKVHMLSLKFLCYVFPFSCFVARECNIPQIFSCEVLWKWRL